MEVRVPSGDKIDVTVRSDAHADALWGTETRREENVLDETIAWHGMARLGTAGHGTARHGTARHGTARHGMAWHVTRARACFYMFTRGCWYCSHVASSLVGRYAPLGPQRFLKPRNTLYVFPTELKPDRKYIITACPRARVEHGPA